MFDVLVIGSGMAGSIAALVARRQGAKVALASRSWGATALATGALDIAYAPALSPAHQEARTVAEHVLDIAAHRGRHPFAVLGIEQVLPAIQSGFATLREVLGPDLAPPALDLQAENRYLPSSLGVAAPAAAALAPHTGIDLSMPQSGTWGVLQLCGHTQLEARRVAHGVQADAQALAGKKPTFEVIAVDIDGSSSPMVLARSFDDRRNTDALAEALARRADGFAGIIAPPVLGLTRHAMVRKALMEAAGIPVVEALAHMPSVPGVRLQQALDRAVDAAGVERVGDVVSTSADAQGLRSVTTRDDLEILAASFVLATGRFIAGGVTWEESCRESLLGLPVVGEVGLMEDDSPHPVVRDTPQESHPLMTAGVQIDATLRPIREGRVAFANLFAAGMVIGGFASRYTLCAEGVALATGHLAGKAAAEFGGGLG